jgi:aquaporin Z
MKKYIAELLGTFGLALAVVLSLAGKFPIPPAVIGALALGLFVYSIGHVSGAHLNPAVTVGLWSVKKIGYKDAIGYIVAQFLGAALALLVAGALAHHAPLRVTDTIIIGVAEAIGTFFFTFGAAAVMSNKVNSAVGGVVMAGSFLLGISIAAVLSNGLLNPALALAVGSFSWMYLLGPVVGSIIGMNAYKLVSDEK